MSTASNTNPVVLSSRQSIGRDLVAGLVVFLVAVPLCLGIAHASGVPIIAGILSGIIGGILVGLLSGSHVSVAGPAAGLTAIVLSQLKILGSFEAFLLAVALGGIMQLGLGLVRAGVLANYFPSNVIKGLLAAIGVILILKQAPHLVGHDADDEGEMSFAQPDGQNTFTEIIDSLGDFLPGAALIGLLCAALLIGWDRSRLKKGLFPAPLAAVMLGVAISETLRLTGSAWAIAESHLVSVPVLGQNGQGWDTIFRLPDFSQVANPKVYVAAATLAIVASLETLLNLEATDKLDPQRRVSPPNRELIAQGIGNVAAGLVGGLPMTSVIVRSSVNANAGGRTRLATITHGLLLVVCVFLLPTLLNRIPLSALAAILVVTGFKLANPTLFRQMWKDGWTQFVPFVITVIAIVLTDLLIGVMIGLAVSLLFLLNSSLRRGMTIIRETHASGIVHRIELPNQVSFLNRAALMRALETFKRGDQVVLDARACDYLDQDILGLIRSFRDEAGPARGHQRQPERVPEPLRPRRLDPVPGRHHPRCAGHPHATAGSRAAARRQPAIRVGSPTSPRSGPTGGCHQRRAAPDGRGAELHRLPRAGGDAAGSGHRRHLQLPPRRQCALSQGDGQHGIRLQGGGREAGHGAGAHRMRSREGCVRPRHGRCGDGRVPRTVQPSVPAGTAA